MNTAKIVILGAGYGGLMTAVRLQKLLAWDEAEVTLVNKHSYHHFTTWLHELAAGAIPPHKCRISIDEVIDTSRIRFVKGVVCDIHRGEQLVVLESGQTISYDYLVLALGSEPETFGIQGLAENALNIRSINSARHIREHIEYQFSQYQIDKRPERLTVVVGGAGFTGIEFVGELVNRLPELCQKFDVHPDDVKIYNIEAAPSVLPGFDPDLVQYATDLLVEKGVRLKINTPIKECTANRVFLANGEEIKTNTVIWTGGVRGNSLIERAGFETVRGRVKVDPFLRAPHHENVFVVGDCALVINEEARRPYPPTAQIALQQGKQLGNNLVALIRGEPLQPFIPKLKGTVASLGPNQAIGLIGSKKVYGNSAALLKKIIDNRSLFLLGGMSLVAKKAKW
ncbi:NAD(P)/FAD-dependent oxidoreductase [Brevibacillus sp. WF146]|jgi:NADH:ubiquinone reductase (H+-translocating)|uniref:NAD(P)/FAD-dependent oxidoreductase n=1 Tax=Brevibacillus sp. WF146 TaxID=319501 RepID=UPI0007ED4F84|nr:NAD(P)/FAD-dependent oxidoreductase [Brevibacillus sp. WF146]UYZ12604.1 NAD(P)/FAD-dependent oxidoreductase [Brevibacillus sp. WF146]